MSHLSTYKGDTETRHDGTGDSGLKPSLKNICMAWDLKLPPAVIKSCIDYIIKFYSETFLHLAKD